MSRPIKKETSMLVPLITFETIAAVYGEQFARTWFKPFSAVRPTR